MRWILTPLVCVCLIAASAPVAAQSRPERPFRGLFGRDAGGLEQSLDVSGAFGVGYDSDLGQEAKEADIVASNPASHRGGGLGQLSAMMSYVLSTERASVSARAGTSARYYPSLESATLDRATLERSAFVRRENVSARASAQLGLGLAADANVGYQPFSVSALHSGFFSPDFGEPSTDFDYGASYQHNLSYGAGLSWSHGLSRRTSVSLSSDYASRLETSTVPKYRSYSAGGGLTHNLGRGVDLNLGYHYREARYADDEPYATHGIEAGVDYQRPLSFSRRTSLSFNTGTTATDDPTTQGGLRLRATGGVALIHEMGRTWSATASYARQVNFTENWLEPVSSDSISVGVGGQMNRRARLHARGGTSTGRVGSAETGGFDTFFADAGLNYALGRHAAFGTSYRYHYHDFAPGAMLAPGIPALTRRHSVQAYISLGTVIFQRAPRRQ